MGRMTDDSYSRLERFYRGLIGERAEQLRRLRERSGLKIARAVPGRFDRARLWRLVEELKLIVGRAQREFAPRPVYDDAVLIDTELAGRLSEQRVLDEGGVYIQAAPSYLVIRHLQGVSPESMNGGESAEGGGPTASQIEEASYALDLCASPGGKALHVYDRFERRRPVIANEYSQARRMRLVSVLRTYGAEALPMVGIDAGTVCRFAVNEIPLIVLDAPCSGEAHLVRNAKALSQWRPRQTQMLALRQRGMASSAVHALKPGGILLYSTCTISPFENELMVDDLLKRFGDAIEPIPWPKGVIDEFANDPADLEVLSEVEGKQIDERIVRCAWRFWPAALGEPFFAVQIRKVKPTQPKREAKPVPIGYPHHKSKQARRPVRVGPAGREYAVPSEWPELPGLPYLRMG